MSNVVYQEERFTRKLYEEVKPLLLDHYEEISKNKDIAFNPHIQVYEILADYDKLVCVTARSDGKLIGYICFILAEALHYQQSLQAQQDVIFVSKEHRKGLTGYKLIKIADEILKERGVQLVQQHVKVENDFSPVLERQGYKMVEKILTKRLDL